MTRGIIYVAYGDAACRECVLSLRALRKVSNLPVAVVAEYPLGRGTTHIPFGPVDPGARLAKLNLDSLSPFDISLYLDADTRPLADPAPLLDAVEAGWDLSITPSINQADGGEGWLWHCDARERERVGELWTFPPLVLQAGVFAFAKTEATRRLFACWRQAFRGKMDQGALLVALHGAPVRVALFGHDWNGGVLCEHHYGRAALH